MKENKTLSSTITLSAILIAISLTSVQRQSFAQSDSASINTKRLNTFVIAAGAGYGATLFGLHQLWYRHAEKQSFRFFNDNAEWKQIDKLGHFYSSFYFSYGTARALRWCRLHPAKADLLGAITGFLILAPIEIFDGYSAAYGASSGDLIANATGPAFFWGQQMLWNEIRFTPKFSFHRTHLAPRYPQVLGDNALSEIFKDYNGQTYWISADLDKFITFPKWLNIAIGYGAHEMIRGRDRENVALGYNAYRQYYFSLDFDLKAIRTRSKLIKTLIFLASAIKLPSPTLEFSQRRMKMHALYF